MPSRVDEKVDSSKGSSFGEVVFQTALAHSVAITLSAKEKQMHLFHTNPKDAVAILQLRSKFSSVCAGILYQVFSATFILASEIFKIPKPAEHTIQNTLLAQSMHNSFHIHNSFLQNSFHTFRQYNSTKFSVFFTEFSFQFIYSSELFDRTLSADREIPYFAPRLLHAMIATVRSSLKLGLLPKCFVIYSK